MKLKQMTCKNCNAPLKLEGDKMVCSYCGGVFEIEKDKEDIEYEMVTHAEEYILRSLTDTKAAMNERFEREEQERIRREEDELAARLQREKEIRRKRRIRNLRDFIIVVVLFAVIFFGAKYLSDKYGVDKEEQEAKRIANGHEKTYRVTKKQLLANEDFYEDMIEKAEERERSLYRFGLYDDDGVIWNLDDDPEILEKYLVTFDSGNSLYVMFKTTLSDPDGNTMEIYNYIGVEDFTADKKGKLKFDHPGDPSVEPVVTLGYDDWWNGFFDRETCHAEAIDDLINLDASEYIIYEL